MCAKFGMDMIFLHKKRDKGRICNQNLVALFRSSNGYTNEQARTAILYPSAASLV